MDRQGRSFHRVNCGTGVALILATACVAADLPDRYVRAADLSVQAGPIRLTVERRFSNAPGARGLLGSRWRMNWEERTQGGGAKTSERFDARGRLIERTYDGINKVTLRYAANGRLARVEGPGGAFLNFRLDSGGKVVHVESSTGSAVDYSYRADALAEVSTNGGMPLRYAYTERGALAGVEDPATGPAEFSYDGSGRLTLIRYADGATERFEYDDARGAERRIDAAGAVTTLEPATQERGIIVVDPLGHKTSIAYDDQGRRVSLTAPNGAVSRITYDASGRVIACQASDGGTTRYEYAGTGALKAVVLPDGRRQEFDYDQRDRLTAIKLSGIIRSAFAYNPDGSLASAREEGQPENRFRYHPDGRIRSESNALGASFSYQYDSRGNLVSVADPLGGRVTGQYDAQGRLIALTDPAGATTRFEYDAAGRRTRLTDAAGGSREYRYDARGRMISSADAAGRTTRYEYDAAGRVTRITRPGGRVLAFTYDLAGNPVQYVDSAGRVTRYQYDAAGRPVLERRPSGLEVRYGYDSNGDLAETGDSTGARTTYRRDAAGRVVAATDSSGAVTRLEYDNVDNVVARIDPAGRRTSTDYTPEGYLAGITEPGGHEARFEYDAAGRLTGVRRPAGGVTRLAYDPVNRLTGVTRPLGKPVRMEYDAAGRLVRRTDEAGRVTEYAYDALGRLLETRLPDGRRLTRQYDALGRLLQVDDGSFPIRYGYDLAGNRTRIEYPALKRAVNYQFDASGLRTALTDTEGLQTRYEYSPAGQLSAILLPDGSRIGLSYDARDRLQTLTYPNGITGRYGYDPASRVVSIRYEDRQRRPIQGWDYRYDLLGNLVEKRDVRGVVSRYGYDAAGQLIDESAAGISRRFEYGLGGNRAKLSDGSAAIDYIHDAADRVLRAGAEELSYDDGGKLTRKATSKGIVRYEYDATDRLVRMVRPDGSTVSYGYAPRGERVWKRDRNGLTWYVYDGFKLLAELGEDLRPRATYIHGPSLDFPLVMKRGNRTWYYHADRLGSIMFLTDERGQVAASYDYDAFGELRQKTGDVSNPFLFTARELEEAPGLYYFRARYYDARMGRFLSPDPSPQLADMPLDLNPYTYARNNPLRYVDPLGLQYFGREQLEKWTSEELLLLSRDPDWGASDVETAEQILRERGLLAPQPTRQAILRRLIRQAEEALEQLEDKSSRKAKYFERELARLKQKLAALPPETTPEPPPQSGARVPEEPTRAQAVRPDAVRPRGDVTFVAPVQPDRPGIFARVSGSVEDVLGRYPKSSFAALSAVAIAACLYGGGSPAACVATVAVEAGIGYLAGPLGTIAVATLVNFGPETYLGIRDALDARWQRNARQAQQQFNIRSDPEQRRRLQDQLDTLLGHEQPGRSGISRRSGISSRSEVGVLLGQINDKRNEIRALAATAKQPPAPNLRQDVRSLAPAFETSRQACRKAGTLDSEVAARRAEMESQRGSLRGILQNALTLSTRCSSDADVAALRQLAQAAVAAVVRIDRAAALATDARLGLVREQNNIFLAKEQLKSLNQLIGAQQRALRDRRAALEQAERIFLEELPELLRQYEPKARSVIAEAKAWRAALPPELPPDLSDQMKTDIWTIDRIEQDLQVPEAKDLPSLLEEARSNVDDWGQLQRDLEQLAAGYASAVCDRFAVRASSPDTVLAQIAATTNQVHLEFAQQNPNNFIARCGAQNSCTQALAAASQRIQMLDLPRARASLDAAKPLNCPGYAAAEQSYLRADTVLKNFRNATAGATATCNFDYGIGAASTLIGSYRGSPPAGEAADSLRKLEAWKAARQRIDYYLGRVDGAFTLAEARPYLEEARALATLPCLEALVAAAEGRMNSRFGAVTVPGRLSRPPAAPATPGQSPGGPTRPAPAPPAIPVCSGDIKANPQQGYEGEQGTFTITIGPDMAKNISTVSLKARGPNVVQATPRGGGVWTHPFRFRGIAGRVTVTFMAYDRAGQLRCQTSTVVYSRGARAGGK